MSIQTESITSSSADAAGPYQVVDIVGEGHNPEINKLKDGSYFLYASKDFRMTYYHSESLEGPWALKEMHYDSRQRQIDQHMANNTFCKREDGSVLMVGRGGGIWISEDGHPPCKQITSKSVYPPYQGKYEDPIVWKTNIQYHLIVNDWLGRIAYYMRSKDAISWKLDDGEAYLPGIAKHQDGTVEDWYKFERIKVLQDKNRRVYQTNFAVNDTAKREDLANDIHSSKNLCIPMTVGRLIQLVDTQKIDSETQNIRLLLKAEPGFDPHKDVDLDSLRFGAPEVVDYGKGCSVLKSKRQGKDLVLTFAGRGNGISEHNFAAKLLGKTTKIELLFGYSRLPWGEYQEAILSSKFPEMTLNGSSLKADIEIENLGLVASSEAECRLEYLENDTWLTFGKTKIPAARPYETMRVSIAGNKIQDRNEVVNVRVTIIQAQQAPIILEGPVITR